MIGIRREDKNRWERRAPLTPDHLAHLVDDHALRFVVQPFPRRVFADIDYRKAGATIDEDLSGARVILGVKELPLEQILPGKTYLFFSHTAKGQAYNVPMLRRLLELNCTLIDYENIVDDGGRRLIFFGRHAGYAGMIDTLWALGQRLAIEGHHTPFEGVRLTHDYSSLDEATHHISRIGDTVRHAGLPEAIRPLVIAFTGSGNVTQGALEIAQRLPTIEIEPHEIDEIGSEGLPADNVIYTVRFSRETRYVRRDGRPGDPSDLARHPTAYQSGIGRWLDRLTVLVHGAFWNPAQPRLVTVADLRRVYADPDARLRVIGDISCDIGGAIESTVRPTTPGAPVFVFDVERGTASDGLEGKGPVMMAIDNLPCELPVEASQHFGDTLVRFVPALARCDWTRPFGELDLPRPILRATIAHRGELTPGFAYLANHLRSA